MVRGECFRIRTQRGARGGEQRGERFAVVVQSDLVGGGATIVVVPSSRSALDAPYRPSVEIAGSPTRLLVDKMRASAVERLGKSVGRLSAAEMIAVDNAMRIVLGLR